MEFSSKIIKIFPTNCFFVQTSEKLTQGSEIFCKIGENTAFIAIFLRNFANFRKFWGGAPRTPYEAGHNLETPPIFYPAYATDAGWIACWKEYVKKGNTSNRDYFRNKGLFGNVISVCNLEKLKTILNQNLKNCNVMIHNFGWLLISIIKLDQRARHPSGPFHLVTI